MTLVAIKRIISERRIGVIMGVRVLDGSGTPQGALRVRALRRVMVGEPALGEIWRVEGPVTQTEWGPQMDALLAVRVRPSGVLMRDYLASHVPGIGTERAERLWATYGTDLSDVLLAGDLDALGKVIAPDRPILGPQLAAATVRAWRDAETETQLIAWLEARGVADTYLARRVAAILGEKAVATLEKNPWCLVPLLPWESVDALGCRLLREAGQTEIEEAVDRLIGAADAAIKDVIAHGDTMVTSAALQMRIGGKLGISAEHQRVAKAIAVGARNGAIIAKDAGIWRAPGCALMEDTVVERLRTMLTRSTAASGQSTAMLTQPAEASLTALHPEQRAAVLKVLASPFSCLCGGAGVGKTHVTRAICETWEASGGTVVLAALAGKAALRLSRATGRLARTLARLIRELDVRAKLNTTLNDRDDGSEHPIGDQHAQLAEITARSLVIVDEASMVDIASMHALLRRMPEGAHLLLVGDERQLPPVGCGLVFHRLVHDETFTARLTIVHRQSDASGIPAVANAIRQRRMPQLRSYAGLGDGVSLFSAMDTDAIEEGVLRVFSDFVGGDTLVITPTRSKRAGVRALNSRLHAVHSAASPSYEMFSPLGERFCVGEPIVHERNDYERGLWNGSIGRVKAIESDELLAEFDGEQHRFARDGLIDLALGYALTCHRAQGSQARRVIVAMPQSRLLDPSWLYTALTRAERQVVLVGNQSTIERLLDRPWAADRRLVGLEWR